MSMIPIEASNQFASRTMKLAFITMKLAFITTKVAFIAIDVVFIRMADATMEPAQGRRDGVRWLCVVKLVLGSLMQIDKIIAKRWDGN